MKVRDLSPIAAIAGQCVFEGMSKDAAVKAYKACRALKKAVKEYDDERAEASKTLKPEGFDALIEKVQTRQPMTPEETATYIRLGKEYNDKVAEAIKPLGDAEVALAVDKLTPEEFYGLMAANPKLDADALGSLEDVIVQGEPEPKRPKTKKQA